jgi:NTP pyrophosphatase (non-canonical NTP hydrolase)
MTRDEHILKVAEEECCEVAQRISKALRFGMLEVQPTNDGLHPTGNSTNPRGLNNRDRIRQELGDLLGALDMAGVINLSYIGDAELRDYGHQKIRKVEQYLVYSKSVGTLA